MRIYGSPILNPLSSLVFHQRKYFTTMQIYDSPVLNPLSTLVILFCIGNWGHCVMRWRESPTVNVRNSFLRNFPTQISKQREGSVLAGNCHKSNYQNISLIVPFGIDLWQSWGNTMIKLRKKYKELNLVVKKKK